MFIIQDCSICFEDYHAQLIPHSISCGTFFVFLLTSRLSNLIAPSGHVFCRPCLDSLVSSSPKCPHCRTPFARKMIRKVMCALQDSSTLSGDAISEAETIMWEAISTSIKSTDEHEQRKLLARNNSKQSLQEASFSGVSVQPKAGTNE